MSKFVKTIFACIQGKFEWVAKCPPYLHAVDKVEEKALSFGAELQVSENEVVLVKEGMVDACGLLSHCDEELPVQRHKLMVDLELH